MSGASRVRVAWGLGAVVFATALVGTIQFARTGTFSPTFLAWSVGVYAVATLAALALAVTARGDAKPAAGPAPKPVVVYETRTGRLERHGTDGGESFVAVFDDGKHAEADVARRLDVLPATAPEADLESSADAAIAKRSKQGGTST